MTVLRQRHKNMLLAGSIGFLLAMVILVLVYIIGIRNNPKVMNLLIQQEKIETQIKKDETSNVKPTMTQVYVFNEGLRENDVITANDFSTREIDVNYVPDQRIQDSKELIGKKIKCDSSSKMIATKTMVYEEKTRGDLKESIEILNISVPEFIQESDRINLRIHYPTGQDYLVLEDIIISKIYEERLGATLQLNHDEIVCISSAKEDVHLYPGTQLYYTKDIVSYSRAYIGENLRNAYPVNPNTIGYLTSKYNKEEVYEERIILDESLEMFFDQNSEAYSFVPIEEIINDENDPHEEKNEQEEIPETMNRLTNEKEEIQEKDTENVMQEKENTQIIGF